MTEADHKYTFAGFPGAYWDKKAEREAEEERDDREDSES